jgi:hypothetical protein
MLLLAFYKEIAFKRVVFSCFEELSPHYLRILKQAALLVSATAHIRCHTVKEQMTGSALVTYHSSKNWNYSPVITL